jgi:hypothetical protein
MSWQQTNENLKSINIIMENWNKLCYYLSEKITTDILESEFELIVEKGLEILGWNEFSGDFEIRPSFQIGSIKDKMKPDFVIKSNQTGEKLFVIEIKRPKSILINKDQIQLSTYMRQFKLEFGILIGPQIQIFYDGVLNKNENATLIENIEFIRENQKGKLFTELFSKEKFDKSKLNDFAKKSYERINEKKTEKEIKKKILSTEFKEIFNELIIEKLSVEYDISLVSNVLKDLKIDISEKFIISQNTQNQEIKNNIDEISGQINTKQYSRDKTKYVINGNGISLPKNRFVLEFIREYLKHKPTEFRELKNIFLDEYQGSTGVINKLEFVDKKYSSQANKRHFINANEILKSSDNIEFVVSTEWRLENVQNILKVARKAGFQIDEIK